MTNIERYNLKLAKDYIDDIMNNLEKSYNDQTSSDIFLGFKDVDQILGGIQPAELVVIAGRPAIGKTAFIQKVIERQAVTDKQAVCLFTMDMSGQIFIMRLMCSIAEISPLLLKSKSLNDLQWKKIAKTISVLSEAEIFLLDKQRISPAEVRENLIKIKQKINIKLVIIDYFQLMYGDKEKYNNQAEELTDIAYALKDIAKELDIAIVVLSQISKDVDNRKDNVPKLSDLREYGELESAADKIIFISRNSYYDPMSKNKKADIIVARNYNGSLGMASLLFEGTTLNFKDYAVDRKSRK